MNDLAAQFCDAPPALPQATRLRDHLPLAGVRNPSPAVHLLAYAIDDGGVLSYCCFAVERSFPSPNTKATGSAESWRFFGFGMGVMNWAGLRRSMTF